VRRGTAAFSLGLVVFSAVTLWVEGRIPASVPSEAPALEARDLLEALTCVDGRGLVHLGELKAHHQALERYVAAMAKSAPSTTPAMFASVDDRVAFWLNAYQALVLVQLLDVRGGDAGQLSRVWRAWPIGGQYVSLRAIEERYLAGAQDARVWLAMFTGARGGGVPDGAPFDGATLNPQLDDAVRRFVQRRQVVRVEGKTVVLSKVFQVHEAELLAALPEARKNVLQVVWAYLPDSCASSGCETRGELDRACGLRLDGCTVRYAEPDSTLAVSQ
jgi:hypothetical protein